MRQAMQAYFALKRVERGAAYMKIGETGPAVLTLVATLILLARWNDTRIKNLEREKLQREAFMITGPDVQFIVNGVPYDDCVLQMDMWQEASSVGNWEVIADDAGGCVWPAINTITTDLQVTLMVDDPVGVGQIMMRGYVDDVMPFTGPGANAKYYRITGRNRALDLAQHFVTGEWVNTAADVIIGNAAGSG
jgi:hypothetical protein